MNTTQRFNLTCSLPKAGHETVWLATSYGNAGEFEAEGSTPIDALAGLTNTLLYALEKIHEYSRLADE